MSLKELTHDAAATIAGCIVAGAAAASSAYLAGGAPTKEALMASAIIGVAGWYFKRGDKTPIVKADGQ